MSPEKTNEKIIQVGNTLEFHCVNKDCNETIKFSILDVSDNNKLKCSACKKEYTFSEDLLKQLQKFEHLCRAIHNAEDILRNTNVAVDVHGHNVKIPFRLLLTRLNTQLNLDIGGKQIEIQFRLLPLKDV